MHNEKQLQLISSSSAIISTSLLQTAIQFEVLNQQLHWHLPVDNLNLLVCHFECQLPSHGPKGLLGELHGVFSERMGPDMAIANGVPWGRRQ